MFAIFNTISAYLSKNVEINSYLSYPDGCGTEKYASETPKQTTDGMYAMQILPYVENLFVGCTVVDKIEYPQEIEDEID